MGELMFDEVGPNAQDFVKNRPCYGLKPCPLISSLSIPIRSMAARIALSLIALVLLRVLGKTKRPCPVMG